MSFHKIWLVLKREYLTRVKSKGFIIATALTPLALVALVGILVFVNITDAEVEKQIGISDNTGVLYDRLTEINETRYLDVSNLSEDSLRSQVLSEDIDGFIVLDDSVLTYGKTPVMIYGGSGGIGFISSVRSDLRDVIREERLSRENVSEDVRNIFETRTGLEAIKLTEEGESEDNTVAASMVGFALGFMIFMGIFIYGSVLMRGVIEEKTNRIVEVIASSVKPIELMYGKLFGVLGMAVTQFGIWIAFYIGLSLAAAPVAAMIMQAQMESMPEEAAEATASSFDPSSLEQLAIDPSIFLYFLLFFIVGFLIYSAIFAAIGAAVENEQDSQQFMFPVAVPIMLGYFFNVRVMESPDSALSIFTSLFPLTAPINMVTRIATTEVPLLQIILSLVLMVLTFFGIMWLAAKIYRVGILMYGKKPSFKELGKWIKQS
ncbi:ABC transporter permease [Gracilimonas mengyeensis]|uniref:ABC-2 type transport system permease protein n=1 Tax=Gracilimonas mengyeensis TaxID=1302730 RepID=A0A521FLY9_9BACT|nr:ABC transporter permease [Gracilimonas mengyeensis]SMO97104.1 ABC-2 type transport system permease protein [Gracilimonas mengyeensis]